MAKEKEKAQGDEKAYEKILKQMEELKPKKKAAREAVGALVLKHKIKKGETPKDKKVAEEYKKAQSAYKKLKEEWEALEAEAKKLKPATKRVTKYEYPADVVTADDKKRYRAKMRAEKKKAEKGEEKAEKKSGKEKGKEGKKKDKKSKED